MVKWKFLLGKEGNISLGLLGVGAWLGLSKVFNFDIPIMVVGVAGLLLLIGSARMLWGKVK